jgi:chromate reductase, NAD(P)H dehydrogenase (quinone)
MTQTHEPVRIVGMSGSLRKDSFNTATLRAAIELAPQGMTLDTVEIGNLPLYNDDIRHAGYPPTVESFPAKLTKADAILFVTPEYNYSIPGVLKNAIDWASRPPDQAFDGKPVGIMGASPGVIGTARAQYHLRQMLVFLNAFPINKPEVMIGQAATRFDAAGRLVDEATRGFIRQHLQALADWTRQLKRA